ncbi:TPA: hypothetical protein JGU28_002429 [Salmonella enterica]|nr:hypothetical protein [Salmonella enterica subsp. enterica serovar Omuna]HAV1237739.1 hypothetical protein [Salmonella enterica]
MSGNVRLLFYGGSKKSGDNWAFSDGAKVVIRDYKKYYPTDTIIAKFVDSAKTIVDIINEQKDGKIASLDIFSHGTPRGLHLYKTASTSHSFTGEDIKEKNLNAGLYAGYWTMWAGDDEHDEIQNISNIDFDKFKTKDAIIELHGCKTGRDPDKVMDSITKNLSEELPDGYIIAHPEPASPDKNHDYRHGTRVVWKDGEVIKTITKSGLLKIEDII